MGMEEGLKMRVHVLIWRSAFKLSSKIKSANRWITYSCEGIDICWNGIKMVYF